MKKNLLLTVMVCLSLVGCTNKTQEKEMETLKNEVATLQREKETLTAEVSKTKESTLADGQILELKSFVVIKKYSFEELHGTVPEIRFVMIDEFQSFSPMLMRIDQALFDTLKEETFYNFKVKAKYQTSGHTSFEIIEAVETTHPFE